MSARLYKYAGASYKDDVLGSDHVTLKCSYPRDFNDPYELFLTIDFTAEPELLAYYAEAIGELPQIPTTCFSRAPIVIPMWAHYAEALRGFAIEFDEQKMEEVFPDAGFRDVDYRDAADEGLSEVLGRAFYTKKMRYTYMLQRGVFSAAYFTKVTCWSYEQERRMIVPEAATKRQGELLLVDVPKECVSALLCGPRVSPETADWLRGMAETLGCRYLNLKIGRSTPTPYFVDSSGVAYSFDGESIRESEFICSSCGEPIDAESDQCSWCRITDEEMLQAARSNPFRMLDSAGLLESYIKAMDEITSKHGEG